MIEGSGVIVEAVACDGACTENTNGVCSGDGNCNSNDYGNGSGNGNSNGKDTIDNSSTEKWFAQTINLAAAEHVATFYDKN